MAVRAGNQIRDGQGGRWTLGTLLKSGGAGSVFLLDGRPGHVAKLYHPSVDLATAERKIDAMLQLDPKLADREWRGQRIIQAAWPTALAYTAERRFAGFIMPLLDIQATSDLEHILQERQAREAGLPTGLGARITLAANLATTIASLHRQHHHVVDLKPLNLRFYRESLYIALLDCDGFSIQGRGERFPAQQVTMDYLAPEFHAKGVNADGEELQDRFALAVIVFQLLNFGLHPFSGRPKTPQVPTDIPGRIRAHGYAYGRRASALIEPNPVSGHAHMPDELRRMFDDAFDPNAQRRPDANAWAQVLRGYAQPGTGKLVICAQEPSHQHFAGLECAACARVQLLKAARETVQRSNAADKKRKKRTLARQTARQAQAGTVVLPTQAPAAAAPTPAVRVPSPARTPAPPARHAVRASNRKLSRAVWTLVITALAGVGSGFVFPALHALDVQKFQGVSFLRLIMGFNSMLLLCTFGVIGFAFWLILRNLLRRTP